MQKVMFPRHLEKFQTKKTFKCHLELKFNNFQNRKKEKITIDCYNILIVGINIIEFYVDTINELVFPSFYTSIHFIIF